VDEVIYQDQLLEYCKNISSAANSSGTPLTLYVFPTLASQLNQTIWGDFGVNNSTLSPTLFDLRRIKTASEVWTTPLFLFLFWFWFLFFLASPLTSIFLFHFTHLLQIKLLTWSAVISSDAHVRLMQQAKAGLYEYNLASSFVDYCSNCEYVTSLLTFSTTSKSLFHLFQLHLHPQLTSILPFFQLEFPSLPSYCWCR
jgi:hypothetical protein